VLLDAGESIKVVSEYLGHSDPGFTLRTYTHVMPDTRLVRSPPSMRSSLRRVP
jgi:integrase